MAAAAASRLSRSRSAASSRPSSPARLRAPPGGVRAAPRTSPLARRGRDLVLRRLPVGDEVLGAQALQPFARLLERLDDVGVLLSDRVEQVDRVHRPGHAPAHDEHLGQRWIRVHVQAAKAIREHLALGGEVARGRRQEPVVLRDAVLKLREPVAGTVVGLGRVLDLMADLIVFADVRPRCAARQSRRARDAARRRRRMTAPATRVPRRSGTHERVGDGDLPPWPVTGLGEPRTGRRLTAVRWTREKDQRLVTGSSHPARRPRDPCRVVPSHPDRSGLRRPQGAEGTRFR